jgi:glycosyltransferase involved in cell wall biosynthesis
MSFDDSTKTICIVTARTPLGPGEEFIWPEIAALVVRGLMIEVFPMRPGTRKKHWIDVPEGVTVCWVPLASIREALGIIEVCLSNPIRTLRALWAVVHDSKRVKHKLKNLMAFGRGLVLAGVCRSKGVSHIHAHWGSTTATAAFVASTITGIPWSFTLHRWDIYDANMLVAKTESAEFVRCISSRGVQDTSNQLPPALRGKVQLVHLGVDLHALELSVKAPYEAHNCITMACVAAMVARKGHAALLEALSVLRTWGVGFRAIFVGDGPLLDEIRSRCESLGLTAEVQLMGRLDHSVVLDLYRQHDIDIAVLSTLALGEGVPGEGIPASLMEAMAAGVPVVATDCGGTSELIGSGAGFLVPCNDKIAMATALRDLILDPDKRLDMGRAGYDRVRGGWDANASANALLELMGGNLRDRDG